MKALAILLFLSLVYIGLQHQSFADVILNGQISMNTAQSIIDANYTNMTINSLVVSGQGITIKNAPTGFNRQYNFSSALTSPTPFHVQLTKLNPIESDFKVLTPGLTDVVATVNGSSLYSSIVDGVSTSFVWNGVVNTFNVNAGKAIQEFFFSGMETVRAFLPGNITANYGSVYQTNLTSSNNIFTLISGVAKINGTYNNQNFTIKNALINFFVKKQYNYNTTATPSLNLITNDFLVDCPSSGTGTDLEVWVNETDGHRISSFPSPTCYNNNTLKLFPRFTANGQSGSTFTTVMWVKVINATWLNNATLKSNTTMITTALSSPYIISNPITVGTGLQNRTLALSMNLTVAPGFVPVNFTVGHISVTGTNHVTAPITFSSSVINSSASSVTVTFPSTYNMGYDLVFNNEGTKKTLTGLSTTSPSLGISQSVITFKNPQNDTVSIKAYDLVSKNNATYQMTQTGNQIPFVQQIKNFKNGTYGTTGMIGAIDIVTLIVLIVAMVGLNRVNETLGAVIMVMVIGGVAYFGIVQWQIWITAAIALVLLVIVSSTKKLPWS